MDAEIANWIKNSRTTRHENGAKRQNTVGRGAPIRHASAIFGTASSGEGGAAASSGPS